MSILISKTNSFRFMNLATNFKSFFLSTSNTPKKPKIKVVTNFKDSRFMQKENKLMEATLFRKISSVPKMAVFFF